MDAKTTFTEINPINNCVDISNYIMEEWGQPSICMILTKLYILQKLKNLKLVFVTL